MSLLQFPKRHQRTDAPMLILLDLQKEYVSSGRAFSIDQIDGCIGNCQRLLDAGRANGLPIAHFRQLMSGPYFNPSTSFSEWIEEFRPRPSEMVYERRMPSCYDNEIFSAFMESMGNPVLFLAGLTAERACLSTIVDAAHRQHSITFISDASASLEIGGRSSSESHGFVSDLIQEYCDVISTDEALNRLTDADPRRWRAMGG